MMDPRQMLLSIGGGFLALSVVGGLGTYIKIERERNAARAEVHEAIASMSDFCIRAIAQCKDAEDIVSDAIVLYSDYLTEIKDKRLGFEEANRKRQELISNRETASTRVDTLLRLVDENRAKARSQMQTFDQLLLHPNHLANADREKLVEEFNLCREELALLDARRKRLEALRIKNDSLLDEMTRSASKFLDAIREAEETEATISQFQQRSDSRRQEIRRSTQRIEEVVGNLRKSLNSMEKR